MKTKSVAKSDYRHIIREIFDLKLSEKIEKIEKIRFGKINKTFLINNKYIIKFATNPDRGFAKDYFVSKKFKELPIPECLIYDNSKRVIDQEYIILKKLSGVNLSSIWTGLNLQEQENIFKQLIEVLKKFHSYHSDKFGEYLNKSELRPNWSDIFTMQFNKSFNLIKTNKFINKELQQNIISYFQKYIYVLKGNTISPSFCHNDLIFSNILVENNKITGILDFDLSIFAPFDFEFEILISFFKQPQFSVDNSLKNEYKKPLTHCFTWLKKYYEDLYKIPNIKLRMSLYSISGNMIMLWLCDLFGHGVDQKEKIVVRIKEILKDRYEF